MFEIRVISLRHQIDRRNKISAMFEGEGIKWSFFDAIPGKEISDYLGMYDRENRLKNLGYDLRPNEIACFLSHRMVWQECVRKNTPFLILEDDVQINPEFDGFSEIEKVLNNIIDSIQEESLFVRLGNLFKRNFSSLKSINKNIDIVRYHRDPSTAMGYVLSPYVANKLLRGSEKFYCPVDNYMWSGWLHDCCMLDVYPNLFYTSDLDTPSSIGDRSKPRISLWNKIKREYFRAINNWVRSSYEKRMIKSLGEDNKNIFR